MSRSDIFLLSHLLYFIIEEKEEQEQFRYDNKACWNEMRRLALFNVIKYDLYLYENRYDRNEYIADCKQHVKRWRITTQQQLHDKLCNIREDLEGLSGGSKLLQYERTYERMAEFIPQMCELLEIPLTPQPLKRLRTEEKPEPQLTYLLSIEYEETDEYPVKILMHGIAEEDAALMAYMEANQDKEHHQWSNDMLLAVEQRVVDRKWTAGKEMEGMGFSTEEGIHLQHFYGDSLPFYLGRIDRCLCVTIPAWITSRE